jgi:hypothetical protein
MFEFSRPFAKSAVRAILADFMFCPGCRPAKTAHRWIPSTRLTSGEFSQSSQTHHRKHNKQLFPVSKASSCFEIFKIKHDARQMTSPNKAKIRTCEVHSRSRHSRHIIRITASKTINHTRITGKNAVFTVSISLIAP